MKIKLGLISTFSAILLTIFRAEAQTSATSVPEGAVSWFMPATTQTTSFFFSLPLSADPLGVYDIASLTSSSVTVSGTPWTDSALAQPQAPYFVRFITGTQKGRMIKVNSNTVNTLVLDTTDNSSQTTALDIVGFSVAVGDKFEVLPGDTLSSIFGDGSVSNPLTLVGTSGPLSADSVSILDKTTSRFNTYYFNTINGCWRLVSDPTNQNNRVIYPESGLSITRRTGRPALTLTFIGRVPVIAPLIKTVGGAQFIVSTTSYPVDSTLAQLNLSNWTKNDSPLGADTLSIYNATTGKNDSYYQKLNGTWRRVGDAVTDQSDLSIPCGSSIYLTKRGTVVNASSYITAAMPYTP